MCWRVFPRSSWLQTPPPAAPEERCGHLPSDAAWWRTAASVWSPQPVAPEVWQSGLVLIGQHKECGCGHGRKGLLSHLGVMNLRGQTGHILAQFDVLPLCFVKKVCYTLQLHLQWQSWNVSICIAYGVILWEKSSLLQICCVLYISNGILQYKYFKEEQTVDTFYILNTTASEKTAYRLLHFCCIG